MATPPRLTHEPLIVEANLPQPQELFPRFAGQRLPVFLDSSLQGGRLGRYSFLACDPFLVLRSAGRSIRVRGRTGTRETEGDPFLVLQGLLEEYALPPDVGPVPLLGGAVGYLGYDLGRLVERLPVIAANDQPSIPECCFAFYDVVVAYDHQESRGYLVSTGMPEPMGSRRAERAKRRLAWLKDITGMPPTPPRAPVRHAGDAVLESNFTRENYLRAVEKAREHIIAGDIYQVNLSQKFRAPWKGSPSALYERLRTGNPAPFAAYQDFGDFAVISASPERFLRLSGDVIETRPIKGTRPRGRTPEEDLRLGGELEASAKDRAEHIMIVDLERSDLGRVAVTGTVTVDELMALERYATVFHLTTTIRARLRPDRGVADLLRATFPGGSITGAPKIRSMEIIEELEPTRRGIYTGAIGYISFTGDLDLNIAIRTIVLQGGVASLQLGGGIVYDSDPAKEYQETLDKGIALMRALGVEPPVVS